MTTFNNRSSYKTISGTAYGDYVTIEGKAGNDNIYNNKKKYSQAIE